MIKTLTYIITAGIETEDLAERIEEAQKNARRIAIGDLQSEEEIENFFRMVIAAARSVPMFCKELKDYSLEELAFEAEIVSFKGGDSTEQLSKIIEDNKTEAENLFDDWETQTEMEFSDSDLDFMNEGKFVED